MEVSSYTIKETTDFSKKLTNVQVINSSFINENDDGNGNQGLIGEAMKIHGNVSFALKNGLISGFAQAAILGSTFEINDLNLRAVSLTNCYINNCKKNIISELGAVFDNDLEEFYGNVAFNNLYQFISSADTFLDPKNQKLPDYRFKLNKVN